LNRNVKDLGTLGGIDSSAFGINASGQVVGESETKRSDARHAVMWTNGKIKDLGTLGGANSTASSINASGAVVGDADTNSGTIVAFLYWKRRMIDLNALLPPGSGWALMGARSINDNGWITGYGYINGKQHAFLLRP